MNDARGYALGVDLGTSNTVAVLRWPDGRTRPLLFDGAPVMPSAVYLDEAGRLHVGRDAQRMASADAARLEPNPKRRVDEASVLLGDREVSTVDLLGALLAAVARAAVEAVGFLPPAVLTYPAAWGPRRREVLAAAATRAGWPPVRFVPEPVAAARYFADVLHRPVPVGQALAVFDFGGGTLDVAVVRNDGPAGFTVLGDGGLPDLGGLDVDAALVAHLGRLLQQTQPAAWQPLATPGGTGTQLRQRQLFWDDVRGAKEMLSRAPVAPVPVPGVEQAVHLTREELERTAGPLLQRAVYEAAAVIQRCGLRPDQLAGLFLVGGSSRLPLVARLLHAHLGIAPTVLEQPELPVAEGAIAELVPPAGSASLAPVSPVPAPVSPVPSRGSAFVPAMSPPAPISPLPPASPPPAPIPPSPAPVPPPRRSRRRLWIPVAAAVALVAVLAAAVFLLRSGPYSEVNFVSSLAEPVAVPMDFDSNASVDSPLIALSGDDAFVAMEHDKTLRVQDWDIAAKKRRWLKEITAPSQASSVDWQALRVAGDMLLVTAHTYGTPQAYSLYAMKTSDGTQAWDRAMPDGDTFWVSGAHLVYESKNDHKLLGIDPRDNSTQWSVNEPTDQYNSAKSNIAWTITDADLAHPADILGEPNWSDASDTRIVLVGADRSAQLIDIGSGKVLKRQSNVADPDDLLMAYRDRFYIATKDDAGYSLYSRNLSDLGGQRLIYQSTDSDRKASLIRPCAGRACLLDQKGYDDATTMLRVVDPGAGHLAWEKAAKNAVGITPVGDRVLVFGDSSNVFDTLYDQKGTRLVNDQSDKAWVRLNSGSVLLFSESLSSYPDDESVTGYGAQSKKKTPLGVLHQVRASSCDWTEKLIVCARDSDFAIWQLAR